MLRPRPQSSGSYRNYRAGDRGKGDEDLDENGVEGDTGVRGLAIESAAHKERAPRFRRGKPLVIWLIGGPGSAKFERITEVSKHYPTWSVISVGQVRFSSKSQYLQPSHLQCR